MGTTSPEEIQQAQRDILELRDLLKHLTPGQRVLGLSAIVQANAQMQLARQIAQSVETLKNDGVRLWGLGH